VGPVGEPAHASPRAPDGGARYTVGRPHGGRGLEPRRRGLFVPRRPPGLGEERVDEPPAFVNAQEEQQFWADVDG
jgi:hypothetical protein